MSKKKVLICGATGFIGRNLLEALVKNSNWELLGTFHKRLPFIDKRIKWIKADLTRLKDVKKLLKGVDIVIQAAATTSGVKDIVTRPYIHVTDNALMNSLLFRSAHEAKVLHFIFFSCSIIYSSSSTPIKETAFKDDTNIDPVYFGAGWTKVYLEKMAEFFSGISPTRYTVIRHSNIYGPYDNFDLEHSHVFGASITKLFHCTNGEITIWGDGSEQRDLLYISDLVDFVQLAIEKQDTPFCRLNVGYGSSISISELINKMIKISGKKIITKHDLSKPTIPARIALNCAEAKRLFGWEPKVALDDGIRKTIDWYKSNILIP